MGVAMNIIVEKSLLLGVLFSIASCNTIADEYQLFSQQSQVAIKEFAGTLKGALVSAMKSGGPIEAIKVCNQVAPSIAQNLSEKYDLEIARTSLKVRNPSNSPDKWEQTVLNQFENRKINGEAIKTLTFSEIISNKDGQQMRMMKAIPTGQVCLTCHGSKLDETIQATLNTLYPNDQATGFSLGDIRGAFTIQKTLSVYK